MELMAEIINNIRNSSDENENGVSEAMNQALTLVLEEMMGKGDDINAAMICSVDGIPWATQLEPGFDQNRFAAMSGTLLALSDSLAREGNKGETNNVLIEGAEGNILVLHAGKNLVLTVFTNGNSNLGISLAFARQATETISALIENS